jgi:hypothetical protein
MWRLNLECAMSRGIGVIDEFEPEDIRVEATCALQLSCIRSQLRCGDGYMGV